MADPYSLRAIGRANQAGALIPVHSGAMTLSGMATVVARADNPFPFGRRPDGTPSYPPRYEGVFRRFYPFLENCQYRISRLREYAAGDREADVCYPPDAGKLALSEGEGHAAVSALFRS